MSDIGWKIDDHDKKHKKSKHKSKKKDDKKKHLESSSSGSSSDSDSSSDGGKKVRKNRHQEKIKKKELKEAKKAQKKLEKKIKKAAKKGGNCNIPIDLMNNKANAPETREEWLAKQSIIRKVVDPVTGRERLIRGDGEVLEECVSRDRHKEINRQATAGDGNFFQSQTLGWNIPKN